MVLETTTWNYFFLRKYNGTKNGQNKPMQFSMQKSGTTIGSISPRLYFRESNAWDPACSDWLSCIGVCQSVTLDCPRNTVLDGALILLRKRKKIRCGLYLITLATRPTRSPVHLLYCAVDRYYWHAWDPVHVCEGLFAVGNLLNFTRLFHLLAINEHLGPMLISLERMIKVSRAATPSE